MATVYEIITDRVRESLSAGVVPWRNPWKGEGRAGARSTHGFQVRRFQPVFANE